MCYHMNYVMIRASLQTFSALGRRYLVSSQVPLALKAKAMNSIPNKLYVRCQDNQNYMELSFIYSDDNMHSKKFNFNRDRNEKLENAFSRMKATIQSFSEKKLKKKKKTKLNPIDAVGNASHDCTSNIQISLQHGTVVLPGDIINSEAWIQGALLKIGSSCFEVHYNMPTVISLKLPKHIMAGFAIYPAVDVTFANIRETNYQWYRRVVKSELAGVDPNKIVNSNCQLWLKVGEGCLYIPTNSDINHHLKLVCQPALDAHHGEPVEAISAEPVGAGPGICPFDERHLYTEEHVPFGSFRCVTYNILADLYADRAFAKESLFPYCPEYALDIKYRKQLLLKEIIGYNSDVLCLQEVDKRIFDSYFNPALENIGMSGIMDTKGDQMEGLVLFYRNEKFRLVQNEAITLSKDLSDNPFLKDIFGAISQNERLLLRVLARTTIMQLALLESKEDPSQLLLIGNVHLYFHPDSDHIRLLQGAICIKYIENRMKKAQNDFPDKTCAPLLMGDFNSSPDCGIYKLMTEGSVEADFKDWNSNPDEAVVGLSVSQSRHFSSACGVPLYTNYTLGFNGCLDYIYYDTSQLCVTDVVPLPNHDIVTLNDALPSVVFPSDHLAQICTLKWK